MSTSSEFWFFNLDSSDRSNPFRHRLPRLQSYVPKSVDAWMDQSINPLTDRQIHEGVSYNNCESENEKSCHSPCLSWCGQLNENPTHAHNLPWWAVAGFSHFSLLLEANTAECRYCNAITNGRPKIMSAGISRSRQMGKSDRRQNEYNPRGENNVDAQRRIICLPGWKAPKH